MPLSNEMQVGIIFCCYLRHLRCDLRKRCGSERGRYQHLLLFTPKMKNPFEGDERTDELITSELRLCKHRLRIYTGWLAGWLELLKVVPLSNGMQVGIIFCCYLQHLRSQLLKRCGSERGRYHHLLLFTPKMKIPLDADGRTN